MMMMMMMMMTMMMMVIVFCFDSYQESNSVALHKSREAQGSSLGRGLNSLNGYLLAFAYIYWPCLARDDKMSEGGVIVDRPLA